MLLALLALSLGCRPLRLRAVAAEQETCLQQGPGACVEEANEKVAAGFLELDARATVVRLLQSSATLGPTVVGWPGNAAALPELCKLWLAGLAPEANTPGANLFATISPEQRGDVCARQLGLFSQVAGASPELRCGGLATLLPGERTVSFVRHAEGRHNVAPLAVGARMLDAVLTSDGVQMAKELSSSPLLLGAASGDPSLRAQLVVVSPMRRTIQTAVYGFNASLPAGSVPWVLDPDIQEASDVACDRMDPAAAQQTIRDLGRPDLLAQYRALPPECFHKTGRYDPDYDIVRKRFAAFTRRLLDGPAQRVVAVSHFELLRVGLGQWVGGELVKGPLFGMAEVKTYALAPDGTYRLLADAACASRSGGR